MTTLAPTSPAAIRAFDLDPDANFEALRTLYQRLEWRVPAQVFNAVAQRVDAL